MKLRYSALGIALADDPTVLKLRATLLLQTPVTVSLNRNWAIYGDPVDLMDSWVGYDKYARAFFEWGIPLFHPNPEQVCLNNGDAAPFDKTQVVETVRDGLDDDGLGPKRGIYYDNGNMIMDTRDRSGFGASAGWTGYYRVMPFRESETFEWARGPFCEGVKGYIDPLELAPANKYGPANAEERDEMLKFMTENKPGAISAVGGATLPTMADSNFDGNLSNITLNDSLDQSKL